VYQGEEGDVSIFVLRPRTRAERLVGERPRGARAPPAGRGRVLAIVGERDDGVRAALRDFATSVAAATSTAQAASSSHRLGL
jgi:hypothetical protein